MKRLSLVLLALFAESAHPQEVAVQFDHANLLFRNGGYQQAAEAYEQILANGFECPEIYYNLGNSYFKLNKLADAVLNYERAWRLAPYDEDIAHNLRLVRLRLVDRVDPLPRTFLEEWWQSLLGLNSSDSWGGLAIANLWLAAAGATIFLAARNSLPRKLAAGFASLCIVSCLLCAVAGVQRFSLENDKHSAIVFSPSIAVKSAPDPQSTDLFVIHEGTRVELLDIVGDWKKIRLSDGKVGWLASENMRVI